SGLILDSKTGIITGKVVKKGTYTTNLHAKNTLGEATKKLTIVIGDTIALTPPIGWNGWNSWASKIDAKKIIASANAMVTTGLINHGWTYINIDDSWQGKRGGELTALQPNEKFPDIKGMVETIHSLGLKAGIYSTPYISSYGSYVGGSSEFPNGGETHDTIKINKQPFMHIGKYRFETNDARQMAEWGFDFLKYDWRIDVESTERMSNALKNSGRDIVFSLSNNAPFEKVNDWKRLSNMYRTGPDIKDSWTSLYITTFSLDKWGPYTGPGHWADPDMMIVGKVSIGPVMHDTRLTADEQYSHVSMFSLLAAPMLIGCPIELLDEFTLNLLSNDEVIEVNQDPLGKLARLLAEEDGVQIWVKPMEDGSFAVGLFNIDGYGKTPASYFQWGSETPKQFTFDFSKVGLAGKWELRDIWRQKDLGEYKDSFKTEIRHHGVVVLRMFPK
ncbi:MAG: glycoside hydrolase family 27 protein, partial [Bacteroidetes bacterium]|nr:glycoside hydrolase family 27 protein [Bacteroidota bacterium]